MGRLDAWTMGSHGRDGVFGTAAAPREIKTTGRMDAWPGTRCAARPSSLFCFFFPCVFRPAVQPVVHHKRTPARSAGLCLRCLRARGGSRAAGMARESLFLSTSVGEERARGVPRPPIPSVVLWGRFSALFSSSLSSSLLPHRRQGAWLADRGAWVAHLIFDGRRFVSFLSSVVLRSGDGARLFSFSFVRRFLPVLSRRRRRCHRSLSVSSSRHPACAHALFFLPAVVRRRPFLRFHSPHTPTLTSPSLPPAPAPRLARPCVAAGMVPDARRRGEGTRRGAVRAHTPPRRRCGAGDGFFFCCFATPDGQR
jgi:hypothetical protein